MKAVDIEKAQELIRNLSTSTRILEAVSAGGKRYEISITLRDRSDGGAELNVPRSVDGSPMVKDAIALALREDIKETKAKLKTIGVRL